MLRRKSQDDAARESAPEAAAAAAKDAGSAAPETAAAPEAAAPPNADTVAALARIIELEAALTEAQAQVAAEHDQFLRTLAEFQNFRRRNEDARSEDRQYANREFILALLPILDNFERALAAAESAKSYESVVSGVVMTQRQLLDYLKGMGVEEIEALEQEFDPNLHEAVMRVEDSEHPDNTVVEVVQKGYRMAARVLRPTMVKVARSE